MIRNKKFVVNDNGHCRLCTSPDGEDSMVACDQCDHWFHQQCTGLKNLPGPTEKWLCIQCSEYEVVMTTMTNKMNQMKMELDERAKAHRRSEVHSSSLELELEKYKEELLKAKKEEDSKQDVLKGLADVLQRSKSRSDESLDDNRVSEGRVLSVLMRRQLQSLPTFSGIAREWPIYKRRFLETTESGEYSDSENLIRLQQSLSGAAARSVQALMLDPSNVQQILDRLERQFGQFQKIYKELRDDIDRVKLSGLHTIIDMSDALENLVSHLEAMKKPEYLRDPRMTEDIVSKLPYEMQIKWLETTSSNDPGVRTLRDLLNFIKPRADVLREMGRALPERRNRVNLHQEAVKRCFVCDREHQIKYCSKFRGMAALERIRLVHANGRCQICLRKHKDQCRSYAHCGINGCNGKHHPMLHLKRSPGYNNRRSRNFDSANRKSPTEVAQTNLHYQVPSQVFYQIIPVTIRNGPYQIKTYAFLDPGSSLTLIDSYIADQLKLEGTPAPLKIKWTQNFSKEEKHSTRVQFELEGTSGEKFCVKDVRTVDNLQLPVQTLDYQEMSRDYHHLRRLPIKSFKRAQPKLLIGLNQSHLLLPIDRKYDGPNKPIAIETPLGWLIFGNISGDIHEDHIMIIQEEGEDEENLRQMMQHYFSVEDFGVKVPEVLPESKEITRAKEIIDKTLKYDGNRYEVGLLWREDNTVLPESYTQAYKRLMNEETRFKNKPDVKVWMNATIKEYLDKGYIRKLSQEELEAWEKEIYYLPHFIVYNKNKVPPKPRLVFDAAAKNKGVSLNSVLLAGPDATTSSFGVTTRFREGKYATAGDIKEMFCQIKIIAEDQKKQCFLFRDFDVTRKPDVYTMQVMTFGATCSPACAQIVKNYNAEQFKEIKPKAAKAIETQHYVDDYIDSFNSVEEAIETIKDVTEIHQKAGFYIRNFVSNDKNILTALPQERVQGSPLKQLEDKDSLNEKVLGVYWNTASDSIGFELHFNRLPEAVSNGARPPTMREVLSFVMSIYDPMGLISHLTIHGKILMQKLHVEMTDWDEEISPQSQQQWKQWLTNIARAQEIRIPRWILCNQAKVFELHVFVDASEYAFATAIYTRGIGAYGQTVSVKLVAAKAKVAPVRKLSIPRLELQAAILGARLAQTIQQELRIVPSRTTYWSDSQTVLSWIHSDHRKYKQFVAHRVGEILDTTKIDQWRYVPTGQNPADEGTKEVKGKTKWLTGPTFLWNEEKDWPKSKFNMNTLEEIKDAVMVHDYDQRSFDFISEWRYSDWNKLLKNTTYLKKFTDWVKNKKDFDRTITYNDRVMAENTILQKAQWENFTNEMNDLKRNNDLTISSSIATLIPTLDEHGVMRARSRLQNAISIPQSARMPIILPHEHYISKLIVKSYHERYLHQGDNVVLGAIRQKYWIIKARALLKKIKRECQYCKNKRAAPVAPQMAPLPPCRTAMYAYPFTHTGVDYFGPIEVQVKRSIEKRWGVIFTCMSTRATHVELAERLDTDAFLVCLKNFQNRRGKVQHLYSDNGTNFVGAEKEMKAAIDEIDKKFGGSIAATMEINWTFNPPAAPHFGGAWERLIQSIKKCLKAMPECTQMRKPTIEELRSALIQAEFILNSRPLTHISLDNEDEEPLTPFHFLIGRAGEYAPPYSIPTGCLTKKQYERINLYSQHFWERWQKEYLPTLVKRNKWTKKVEPLKEGDVVLITDKETHPGKWLKGRIVEIRRAADGQVRSAQVKTIQGIYSRPATKIAVLDVRRKEEDKKEEPHASINHVKEMSTKEHGEVNKPKPKPQPPKTNDKTAPPIQAKRIKYPKIKDICIVNHHRELYAHEELPTSSKATRTKPKSTRVPFRSPSFGKSN